MQNPPLKGHTALDVHSTLWRPSPLTEKSQEAFNFQCKPSGFVLRSIFMSFCVKWLNHSLQTCMALLINHNQLNIKLKANFLYTSYGVCGARVISLLKTKIKTLLQVWCIVTFEYVYYHHHYFILFIYFYIFYTFTRTIIHFIIFFILERNV